MHWLIVVPYYFLGSLAALPLLMIACRLVRVKVPINTLVGSAIGLTLAFIAVPLVCDWVDLAAFTARPLLALGLVSFLLAAADGILAGRLPLPLDDELSDL